MTMGTAIRATVLAAVVMGGMETAARTLTPLAGRADAAGVQAVHTCRNFQLTVRPVMTSGAMGHVGTTYQVHNILPGACTLFGYPGAKLLDRNFNSLPTHVRRGLANLAGTGAPVTVTLGGTRDGYFLLEWDHFPSPGQTCPPAAYLMIIPPNDRLPVVTSAGSGNSQIIVCGGDITASPVAAHPFNI